MGTLQEKAIQIRDEERKGANTAPRVGGLLLEMAKLLENSEGNNIYITDLSDLDNYKLPTNRGVFNVYLRGSLFVGVLFIIQYQAPQHGGLQIFLSTFDYKMSGSSSLSMPSIIYRSTDYNNNQKWLEWKPYQNTFISDDGTVPTSGGLGFDNTNFAPSLRMFLEYPKVVEWSGSVTDVDFTPEMSSPYIDDASLIYFSTVKKSFYVFKDGKYYNSWGGELALYLFKGPSDMKLTKNIFKGLDESVWVAVSEDSIQRIDKKDAGTITIDKELNENSTNPVQNAAITKGIEAAKELYVLQGDISLISSTSTAEELKNILGEGTALKNAIEAKKILLSNGIIISAELRSSSSQYLYILKYSVKEKDYNVTVRATNTGTYTPNPSVSITDNSPIYQLPGDIVLPDKSTLSLDAYIESGRSDAIGVVFDAHKGLFVRKNIYSGKLVGNQDPATGIFFGTVGCKAPYDGRTTQKLNLLHSSNPSVDFPVFNYAEQNGWYVAANGELEKISNILESLTAIDSDFVSMSNIASCTQRPKATSSASVFYGGAWGASDYRDPSTALNYLLIDIL